MSDEVKTGKDRVREVLIEPLAALGLRRPSGQTVAQHEAALAEIEARLWYMSEADLVALREVVLLRAQAKGVWLPAAVILDMAKGFAPPPEHDSDMVTSFMRSAAGRRALAEGYEVELYQALKRGQPPTNGYAHKLLADEADGNRRRIARLTRARDGGEVLTTSDSAWLGWYARTRDRARALIPQGEPVGGEGAA